MRTGVVAPWDPARYRRRISSARHAPTRRSVLRRTAPALLPAAIFAASRIGTLAVVYGVAVLTHVRTAALLIRWDAAWYLATAEHGYPTKLPIGTGPQAQSTLGFFPLLPVAIRLVWKATGLSPEASGLLIGALGGLAGSVAIWLLLEHEYGRDAADRGCALVVCSPGAYVLSMVYSETLLLPLAAGCLLALRSRRWWLAGLLAGLASAADPVGIALVVPCAVAALLALRERRELSALAAPGLAPAGIVAFFAYLQVHAGTWQAWFIAQRRGWEQGRLGSGVWNQLLVVRVYHLSSLPYWVKDAGLVLAMVTAGILLATRRPATWTANSGAVLVLAFLSPAVGFGPRTLLRAFPLFAVAGVRLGRRWFGPALALFALVMAALAVLSLGTIALPP